MIAASRGYPCTTVIPETASVERAALSLAFGSEVLTHKLKFFLIICVRKNLYLSLGSKMISLGCSITFNNDVWIRKVSSAVKGHYGITK